MPAALNALKVVPKLVLPAQHLGRYWIKLNGEVANAEANMCSSLAQLLPAYLATLAARRVPTTLRLAVSAALSQTHSLAACQEELAPALLRYSRKRQVRQLLVSLFATLVVRHVFIRLLEDV